MSFAPSRSPTARRRGVSSPTGACWRWSAARPPTPALAPRELALRPWAPAASVFKVSRRRRWSSAACRAPPASATTAASRRSCRTTCSTSRARPPLRDARLRPRQVAERDRRQAREPPPDRRRPRARGARLRLRGSHPFRRSPSSRPTWTCRRRPRIRAHGGRVLALDAVAVAWRPARRDHRQPRRDALADAHRARGRAATGGAHAAGRPPPPRGGRPPPPPRSVA